MGLSSLTSIARDIYTNQEQQRATRDQLAENQARQAFFTAEHRVTGVGYMAMDTPVMFDVVFTHKPFFGFGPEIVKMPDVTHYRYPIGQVGVWKWVTEPTPEAKASKQASLTAAVNAVGGSASDAAVQVQGIDNSAIYRSDELLYKGAYLYFHVAIDPTVTPRSDGSNLAALQAKLAATEPNTATYTQLTALVHEAQTAVYLAAHPPDATMNFSLMWMGTALKGVPDATLDALHSDPQITPITPSYGNAS